MIDAGPESRARYQVITTLGSHFLFNRSILTLGAATPINGNPRLFDIEAIAQFNYRY